VGERSQNLEWTFKIKWRRNLFEWEQEQEQQLMQVMGEQKCVMDKEDSWVWKGKETTTFTVKFAYNILKQGVQGSDRGCLGSSEE